MWLKHFWKATVSLPDRFKAWNWTGKYYTRYRTLLNKIQIIEWLSEAKNHGSKPHQFSFRDFFLNFKRVLEDMEKRFYTFVYFFYITKMVVTILYHKKIKMITHFWYFWSQKCLRDQIFFFRTKFSGPITNDANHQNFWNFHNGKLKVYIWCSEIKIYGQQNQKVPMALESMVNFTSFLQKICQIERGSDFWKMPFHFK